MLQFGKGKIQSVFGGLIEDVIKITSLYLPMNSYQMSGQYNFTEVGVL